MNERDVKYFLVQSLDATVQQLVLEVKRRWPQAQFPVAKEMYRDARPFVTTMGLRWISLMCSDRDSLSSTLYKVELKFC